MGDKRRFDLFADFIATHAPDRNVRIADVAAGKVYLTLALRERGFRNVVPFEPDPRKGAGGKVRRFGLRVQNFTPDMGRDFDVVVGMHPDGATDCILEAAVQSNALAIVVPCCVRPNVWTFWSNGASHWEWVGHLVKESGRRGLALRKDRLPMNGRSGVLFGRKAA